jgi:diadenosine tetraphosphate (Ap4A) HIT family hydrolase
MQQMTKARGQDCEFCDEFERGIRRPEVDAQLSETSRLAVFGPVVALPSVAPLARGHVLVSPRSHRQSLRQCDRGEFDAVVGVALQLGVHFGQLYGPMSFFEHGVGGSDSSGCGVTHAHIHLVPLPDRIHRHVLAALGREFGLTATGPWHVLMKQLDPTAEYLLFGRPDEAVVTVGQRIPSQWVRQIVAQELGKEWDWRGFSEWPVFTATLEGLRRLDGAP